MPEPVATSVRDCMRCHRNHDAITFWPLTHPVQTDKGDQAFTHWTACPTNGEPILMRIEDDEVPDA